MEPAGVPLVLCDDQNQAPVHVSAGGINYTTTLATLTRCPESKLAKLFNGTLAIPLDPINHHYFLDLDGNVFTHVLNFLRYGKLVLPDNFDQLTLLLEQAETLEIESLIVELQRLSKEPGEPYESSVSEAESSVPLKKKMKQRQHKDKRRRVMRNKMCNLLRTLREGFWEVKEEWKQMIQTEEKKQEDYERIVNLISSLGDCFQKLIVNSENKIENIMKGNEIKRQEKNEMMNKVINRLDDGFQKLFQNEGKMGKIINDNEEQRQKGDERIETLMKNLRDFMRRLIVESERKIEKIIEINENQRQKEADQMDKMLKKQDDCFKRLIVDSERKIEKIIKDTDDQRQKEDDRMANLMKKQDDCFQKLVVDSGRKIEKIIQVREDERQQEDGRIDNLIKSLKSGFSRLLDDNESNMMKMIKIQEQRLVNETTSTRALQAGVVILRELINPQPSHVLWIFSYPDEPQLVPPNDVEVKNYSSVVRWIFQDATLLRGVMPNVSTQLILQAYQLITVSICNNDDNGRSTSRDYVFVRS